MSTLMEVGRDPELRDPPIGWSLAKTFFPNGISDEEKQEWRKIREGHTIVTGTQAAPSSDTVEHTVPGEDMEDQEVTGTPLGTRAEPKRGVDSVEPLAVVHPEGSNGSNNLPKTDLEEVPAHQSNYVKPGSASDDRES